jgi:hypothetical protein
MTKKLKVVCQLDSNPLIQSLSSYMNIQNSGVLAAFVINCTELSRVPDKGVGSVRHQTCHCFHCLLDEPHSLFKTFILGLAKLPMCLVHRDSKVIQITCCLVSDKCKSERTFVSARSLAVLRAVRT